MNKNNVKYGDVVSGDEAEPPPCFSMGSICANNKSNGIDEDENIDIEDIHCDDGDSDLDENWDDYIEQFEIEDAFESITPSENALRDSLELKGIGKVKNEKISDIDNNNTDTEILGKGAYGIEGGSLSHFFRSPEHLTVNFK